MGIFPSNKSLTREQLEERLDKAAERFLRTRDDEARCAVIELHGRLQELDEENEKKQVQAPFLQLRDHRLLKRESGYPVWPPIWAKMREKAAPLTGEIGYLQRVLTNETSDKTLFLVIAHEGAEYMGAMAFDDATFCGQFCELLKSNIGRSIKEIGDLDLLHLL